MSSSNLKFWQKDWLTRFGISTRQIVVIIFLTIASISGLILSRIQENSADYYFSKEQDLNYNLFQTKVAEIESLFYAEKKRNNPVETISYQKKVAINEASATELIALPGIGPKLSKRILEFRKKNGKFLRLEDLKRVKGIGEKKFIKMLPYIKL